MAINRNKQCLNNYSGISAIYAFKYVKYKRSDMNVSSNILTKFPYSVVYDLNAINISFKEDIEHSEGGTVFSQSLSFDLLSVLETDDYSEFCNNDWRFIIKTNNNKYKLIGYKTGMIGKYSKDEGNGLNSFSGFKFNFSTKEQQTAPFLVDLTGFYIDEYPFLSDGLGNTIQDGNNNNLQVTI